MVYIPAIGALAGRECKLAPGYIKDFLEQPRFPRPEEYAKFQDNTLFIDLAEASGHMSEENNLVDANGERSDKLESNPSTPHKGGLRGLGYLARPGGSAVAGP